MTQDKKTGMPLPAALVDLLVEDIIESTDAEILEEASKKYKNPSAEADRLRGLVATATIKAKKANFASSKKELEAYKNQQSKNQILDFLLDAKKALIQKARFPALPKGRA